MGYGQRSGGGTASAIHGYRSRNSGTVGGSLVTVITFPSAERCPMSSSAHWLSPSCTITHSVRSRLAKAFCWAGLRRCTSAASAADQSSLRRLPSGQSSAPSPLLPAEVGGGAQTAPQIVSSCCSARASSSSRPPRLCNRLYSANAVVSGSLLPKLPCDSIVLTSLPQEVLVARVSFLLAGSDFFLARLRCQAGSL